jgi:hypothetical protein
MWESYRLIGLFSQLKTIISCQQNNFYTFVKWDKSRGLESAMFNLLTDPWIPTTASFQSLLYVLENAKSVQLTARGSQFASILRLLLAVCYQRGETSKSLLRKGIRPKTLLHLEQFKGSFDLHDGFLTCPDLDANPRTLATLIPSLPAGHTMVFFGHARDNISPELPDATLARYVLDFHGFAAAGGNSVTGVHGLSPCANKVLGIAIGETLLETLALNLVPDSATPHASWTQPRVTKKDYRESIRSIANSFAEQYTWLGQAIRLFESRVGIAKGFKLKFESDPMMARVLDPKGRPLGFVRPASLEPILLAAKLMGMETIAAQTFCHAQTLGIPFDWRIIAQVSSPDHQVRILETIDQSFKCSSLQLPMLFRLLRMRKSLVKWRSEFEARAFVSTFEDRVLLNDGQVQLEEFTKNYPLMLNEYQRTQLLQIAHKD